EGLPRFHLRDPSISVLAGQADAALQRKLGRAATGLAGVIVDAGDESFTRSVGREVWAPTVGETRDPSQDRFRRHRALATADAEPDRDRPLDGQRAEPGV